MIIRPTKWTNKRQESLKGAAMVDVIPQGLRVRAWPRKRGKSATPEQLADMEKFAQAQWAANAIPFAMSLLLRRAVEDTPLLPRDVLTAMMFNRFANAVLPDGRTLYPVTARNDVSQALDAITQTPNATLIRGAEFWEEYPLPSLGNFATLYDAAVPVGTTTIDVSGLEDHQIIVFLIDDMDPATSSRPRFRLSTDGGSSFYSTNGDYRRFADGAATGLTTAAVMTNTASTVERSAMAVLFNTPPGVRNCWLNIVRPDAGYLAASTDTITDVRFLGESSTFGITRLIVLGW